MDAKELYQKMETDFELDKCRDDWSEMDFNGFITENFKERYMGLVADNTGNIERAYTAVFPSRKVLEEILGLGEKNALLFTHHPMAWTTKNPGSVFEDIDKSLLLKLKENKISIYTLHVPLDRNGEYSTTVNFVRAIGISREEDFAEYFGVQAGVIGKIGCETIDELANQTEKVVGHRVKLLRYGPDNIKDQMVAAVGGGGNDLDVMKELIAKGIKTYVTGVIKAINGYPPSVEFLRLAEENQINLIGATHYSTEKFACIKMIEYFGSLGLPAKFIGDEPDFGDLD
jgi:putative NIF3 family GTP cyclohydrolase 1 type 2